MRKKFTVIQIGFDTIGQLLTKLLVKRKNINLLEVVDSNPVFDGKKLSDLLENSETLEIPIVSEIKSLSTKKVDVAFITTSNLESPIDIILKIIEERVNVIMYYEELSYPWVFQPESLEKIDTTAKEKGVTVISVGLNPGYLMDLLPIVLTAPCETVERIHVIRVINSSKRNVAFQKKIGTGLTVGEFKKRVSDGEIAEHRGLEESIQMIVSALGFEIDEIITFPSKPMVTDKEFTSPLGEVHVGYVKGLHSRAVAMKSFNEIIILDFYAYAGEHEEYDSINIEGMPNIQQKIIGGIHGDIGTTSIIANLIPNVVEAKPGFLAMKDIFSTPCNTANVWKK